MRGEIGDVSWAGIHGMLAFREKQELIILGCTGSRGIGCFWLEGVAFSF